MNSKPKYKGGFEPLIAADLEAKGVPVVYETKRFYYSVPHTYTPDFELPNGILIEAKGWLRPEDRAKMRLIKKHYPRWDIRFVFQNASAKIAKKSKTTYGEWAIKYGFKWAEGFVPQEWIDE